MTYNNTVWDKLQSKIWLYLRNIIVGIIALFYLISGIINIVRQYQTIGSAEKINNNLENSLVELEEENTLLKRKLAEATSSAYLERQVREVLGEGKSNDYWLILPEIDDETELSLEKTAEEDKWPIEMWKELFTN